MRRDRVVKINEVSQQFNLSIDTLRYYEKIGLLDKVDKENGIRNYKEKDLERLEFIVCMKQSGMTLETIRQYFELLTEGDKTLEGRLKLLEKQQIAALKQMNELQKSMNYLEFKINLTRDRMKARDKVEANNEQRYSH